jgi:putative DNA primase/helicase
LALPFNRSDITYSPEELKIMAEEADRIAELNRESQRVWEREHVQHALGGSTVKGFTFGDLKEVQFPERATLLARGDTPVLRAGQLAELFAVRGVGKTWLTRTLAIVMASGGDALGFSAPWPARVLYIDGEMASGDIQARDRLLVRVLDLPEAWDSHNLVTVARDWQDDELARLDTEAGQEAMKSLVEWADVVIADNRACLFDPEGEKDSAAWQPAQDWLLSLRRQGKAVLVVHHSNRNGGARGLGRAEDALDLVIKLDRPEHHSPSEGARFILSYEKARGIPGGHALNPFTAALTPEGWVVEGVQGDAAFDRAKRKLREVVRAASDRAEPFQTKTAAVDEAGGNRKTTMKAWDELVDAGAIERRADPKGFHLAE